MTFTFRYFYILEKFVLTIKKLYEKNFICFLTIEHFLEIQ